jgi:hypothetical protein
MATWSGLVRCAATKRNGWGFAPRGWPLAQGTTGRMTACDACLQPVTDAAFVMEACGHTFHPPCLHLWLVTTDSPCPACVRRDQIDTDQPLASFFSMALVGFSAAASALGLLFIAVSLADDVQQGDFHTTSAEGVAVIVARALCGCFVFVGCYRTKAPNLRANTCMVAAACIEVAAGILVAALALAYDCDTRHPGMEDALLCDPEIVAVCMMVPGGGSAALLGRGLSPRLQVYDERVLADHESVSDASQPGTH